MTLHRKKYQNTILYLCWKLKGEVRGKKKLAKLLYFADFDFYEKYQKSITGDVYNAYPKGPLPSALTEVVDELISKKKLSIESVREWGEGYAPTEIFKCLSNPDLKVFDQQEIKMLDRVVKLYGGLNGEQLAELSHSEAPYTATEPYKEIPYEFTYYRGTDFSSL
jgi:uncharacterized phage-associated protein